MKLFEKYQQMLAYCVGKDYNEEALKQYLHIAQVMSKEEESYRNHRKKMLDWLNNIEKSVYDSIKEKEVDDFIERVNPYEKPTSINYDLRGYAKYIKDNNLSSEDITEDIMNMFILKD